MNDSYQELLVQRKPQSREMLVRVLATVVVVMLFFAGVVINPLILVLALIAGFVCFYFIFPKLSVEFEYTLVDQELRIDAVYSQRSRKRKISLDLGSTVVLCRADSHELDAYQRIKVMDYSAMDPDQMPYALVIPVNGETVKLLIQPDEEMISKMSRFLGMRAKLR